MTASGDDPQTVALGVIREPDYEDARAAIGDAERLPDTYAAYIARVAQTEADLTRAGYSVVRVPLAMDGLERFCSQRRLKLDRRARHLYVQHLMSGTAG